MNRPPRLAYTVLLPATALALLPFAWLICACFRNTEDFFNCTFLPVTDGHINLNRLTLGNFHFLFSAKPFGSWMLNSLFVTSLQTVVTVLLSSLGGFALAKYRFAGRRSVQVVMLLTLMLPSQVIVNSSWLLMHRLGWLDTYWAILIPGSVSVFGIFLFRQAMQGIPDELLAAARVDGCSELHLWWEVALPSVRPMVSAYTLMAFLSSWGAFLWPSLVLQDPRKFTLPVGLSNLIGLPSFDTPYGALMAGTLVAILPVLLVFVLLQRDLIRGLASGAVKG